MELKKWIHRQWYIGSWRIRFWWLDTPNGLRTRIALSVLAGIVGIVNLVGMFYIVHRAPDMRHPAHSVITAVVLLIIALVAAVVAIALMPKPKAATPTAGNTPTTDDGQSAKDHWGTCWEDDSFILAWKQMGRDPIKPKSGK